ncbi:MAG TPA: rod shape-determining protein MreC [Gaiellaceae bacterium]
MLGVLVLAALALLTISFRDPNSGPVHGAQGVGASVLRPFQVAAVRVAQPFRDAYGYFSGLAGAKSENARLKRELRAARAQAAANALGARDAKRYKQLLNYETGPAFPQDYTSVNTQVISLPTGFEQKVVIARGSADGLRRYTPVVTADGLVGKVTKVYGHQAQVELITDPDSGVPVVDVSTNVRGLLRRGQGDTLVIERVPKALEVHKGDVIVTAGTRSARYPDIFPRGIRVGEVSSVNVVDTAIDMNIQVTPYVDFASLDSVAALVSRKPPRALP